MILDPTIEAQRIVEHDVKRGYRAHHLRCQQHSNVERLAWLGILERDGYDVVPVLAAGVARALAQRADDVGETLYPADLGAPDKFLAGIFTDRVSELIRSQFQSEFAALFLSLQSVTATNNGLGQSAGWHCDWAPTAHLKILVYLNDDHDGYTEVIDRETTAEFKRIGYFPLTNERLEDLGDLAREHEIVEYDPDCRQPSAGCALIFEPAMVLHKGNPPTHGTRHVLTIGVIPWGLPWGAFLDQHGEFFIGNTEAGFPKMANENDQTQLAS